MAKAEREGDAEHVDRGRARPHAGDHRRAAAEQDERERADEFRNLLLHDIPPNLVPAAAPAA